MSDSTAQRKMARKTRGNEKAETIGTEQIKTKITKEFPTKYKKFEKDEKIEKKTCEKFPKKVN